MHLKNEQGRDLYLNCFDVDSDNVYFIQLDQWKTGQDYSMIEVAQHSTFVTKPKRKMAFIFTG